jgi:protocatechuate 3,4-dioxygenase beta subunit
MDHDDRGTGRRLTRPGLTRRRALLLLAGGGATLAGVSRAASAAAPGGNAVRLACVATPEQTEGPFFVDEKLARSDLRTDAETGRTTPGVPLRLVFTVSGVSAGNCSPIADAQVDVWHCDAAGRYSDVDRNTRAGDKFLRGYQLTDANGRARFVTIYPGGYAGRAVHIHFKIRGAAGASRRYDFTSQLYFDDAITDAVHARAPYPGRGPRSMRNADDVIFRDGGGQLLVALSPDGDGYAGSFDIGLRQQR